MQKLILGGSSQLQRDCHRPGHPQRWIADAHHGLNPRSRAWSVGMCGAVLGKEKPGMGRKVDMSRTATQYEPGGIRGPRHVQGSQAPVLEACGGRIQVPALHDSLCGDGGGASAVDTSTDRTAQQARFHKFRLPVPGLGERPHRCGSHPLLPKARLQDQASVFIQQKQTVMFLSCQAAANRPGRPSGA